MELAAASLTTTFIITQRTAACRRIAASDNQEVQNLYLPGLADGRLFATVGISHLTTSHRHLDRAVLQARYSEGNWILDGFCPWVTGAAFADVLVVGAELESGQQVLLAVPREHCTFKCSKGFEMMALSGSQTGRVDFDNVKVSERFLLARPTHNVMQAGPNASTGGLQTSALALGLAQSALDFLESQSLRRNNINESYAPLRQEWIKLRQQLLSLARGGDRPSQELMRINANRFVLRATQSAMIAAKGAGYMKSHPVGRWCREALFFLVWSCPQTVSDTILCELAGLNE